MLLRGLTEEDCQGAYPSWLNDSEVCRYNSHNRSLYRREDALAYVRQVRQSSVHLVMAITLAENGRHIGNISLQNLDEVNRSAELAILVGEKDCWGKGYSAEAGRLLLQHGFVQLELNRIYCGTPEQHIAMQKLARVLGMREEGRRRQAFFKEGHFQDLVEFSILREEYLPAAKNACIDFSF